MEKCGPDSGLTRSRSDSSRQSRHSENGWDRCPVAVQEQDAHSAVTHVTGPVGTVQGVTGKGDQPRRSGGRKPGLGDYTDVVMTNAVG